MSIREIEPAEQTRKDHSIGDVLGKLMDELAQIADDIDQIPFSDMSLLTKEEIVAYQKIDISSQKLRDFSNILAHLAKNIAFRDSTVPQGILEEVRLEYTTILLAVGER